MNSKKGTGWPVGIFVFYGLFVLALLVVVFITLNNDVDMVTSNYYEKTLVYEDQITRIRNTNTLPTKPEIAFSRDKTNLILTMPEISGARNFNGTVRLFRASDSKLDKNFKLTINDLGQQLIPIANLQKGKWEVQIQWSDGHKEYYFKQVVNI